MVLLDMRGIPDLLFIFLDFFHAVVNLGNTKKEKQNVHRCNFTLELKKANLHISRASS